MRRFSLSFLIFLALAAPAWAANSVHSFYTDITGDLCSTHIDDKLSEARTLKCPGIGGYRVDILADDGRFSVNLISAKKRVFELELWDIVSRGFSNLGPRVEWRVVASGRVARPIAMIIRVNASEVSEEGDEASKSYLAVAQIRDDAACVIAKVEVTSTSGIEEARRIADGGSRPCLTI